ncbi:transposase [Streptomyces sp. Ru87]|uniref:transposase n=1 Tax=Streptomyces sp. Ru87 TaxID=2044307 RepID=UPI0034D30DC8
MVPPRSATGENRRCGRTGTPGSFRAGSSWRGMRPGGVTMLPDDGAIAVMRRVYEAERVHVKAGGFARPTSARSRSAVDMDSATVAVGPVHRAPGRPFRSDRLIVCSGVPLTDAQWARIEPLLPDRTPKRGGRWRDHREVIDAIAWKFQTGSQWVLPERYGNWRGVCNRLRMWAVDGILGAGVHRAHGSGGRRRGLEVGRLGGLHDRACPPARGRGPQIRAAAGEPHGHAIGRSRGGPTTKIHLAADAHCRPLASPSLPDSPETSGSGSPRASGGRSAARCPVPRPALAPPAPARCRCHRTRGPRRAGSPSRGQACASQRCRPNGTRRGSAGWSGPR